jgi:hypothetical protein
MEPAMLTSETKMFFSIPSESRKLILHPATVREATESGHTAELEESNVPFEAGQDLFVYYERRRKFTKQAARIDAVMQNDPTLVVGFQLTGEPVSAESREWFRVSTVMSGLAADFGPETGCPLLDVSSVGFAVEATQTYKIGDVVTATLRIQDKQFSGKARVQGIRDPLRHPLDRGQGVRRRPPQGPAAHQRRRRARAAAPPGRQRLRQPEAAGYKGPLQSCLRQAEDDDDGHSPLAPIRAADRRQQSDRVHEAGRAARWAPPRGLRRSAHVVDHPAGRVLGRGLGFRGHRRLDAGR